MFSTRRCWEIFIILNFAKNWYIYNNINDDNIERTVRLPKLKTFEVVLEKLIFAENASIPTTARSSNDIKYNDTLIASSV